MKKTNVLLIVLELIIIFGYIVIGVTILTYLFQHVAIDRIVIGLILMAVGVFGLTEFFTLKFSVRIKSFPILIVSILSVILGGLFIFIKFNSKDLCIILASCQMAFAIARIATAIVNLLRQPLLNGFRIIIHVTEIVFLIFLLIRTVNVLNAYLIALGIFFLIEATALLIEFLIHRYQN